MPPFASPNRVWVSAKGKKRASRDPGKSRRVARSSGVGRSVEGSYRLATLLDGEFGAWFDPAFLRRIDSTSMAVSIADDERKVLNLRVPGDR